jgi:hypothetical protein
MVGWHRDLLKRPEVRARVNELTIGRSGEAVTVEAMNQYAAEERERVSQVPREALSEGA